MNQISLPDKHDHVWNEEQESNISKLMEELIFQANISSVPEYTDNGLHYLEAEDRQHDNAKRPSRRSTQPDAIVRSSGAASRNQLMKVAGSTSLTTTDNSETIVSTCASDERKMDNPSTCNNESEVILDVFENSVCFMEPTDCSLVANINDVEDSMNENSAWYTTCSTRGYSHNSSIMSTSITDGEIHSTLKWWQKSAIRKAALSIEIDLQDIVSKSTILKQRYRPSTNNSFNDIPNFHRTEIVTGLLLGHGSFSDVREIIGFRLDERIHNKLSKYQQDLRIVAASNVIDPKTGRGRWALKHLKKSLLSKENIHDFELAALDLVVEGEYLSAMQHPNIIATRGAPVDGVRAFSDGQYDSFFIIFDRLDHTLEDRIYKYWKKDETASPNIYQKSQLALQIAHALNYLHQNRIIFRDLKPQNIGFSIDDTDQLILFDFGLCRELPTGNVNDGISNDYEMSGVGTRRYMAPETIEKSRYNLKADVYSWSIVFWEILSESRPYGNHSADDHQTAVCEHGERPRLNTVEWPTSIHALLEQTWHANHQHRLSIIDVCQKLKAFLARYPVGTDRDKNGLDRDKNGLIDAPRSPQCVTDHDELIYSSGVSVKATQCLSDFLESLDTSSGSTNSIGEVASIKSLLESVDVMLPHPIKYNDLTFEYDYGVEVITYL